MQLSITHTTRYSFENPVSYGLMQLRKTPKNTRGQSVIGWTTEVEGGTKETAYEDYHRNRVELISCTPGATTLVLKSAGTVDLTDTVGVLGPHQGATPLWLFARPTDRTAPGAGIRAMCRGLEGQDALSILHQLSSAIRDRVEYEVGSSDVAATAEQVMEAGKGVCQDHTHVFLAAARHLGHPARYVSGYLMMDDRVDQDATHAWAEAHVDGLGWVGFDISNGISPDTRYVRVATGRDYTEASPVRGMRLGGEGEEMSVSVEVSAAQSQSQSQSQ